IYYGSEWGLTGQRHNGSDAALRPALDLAQLTRHNPQPDLAAAITRLARIRHESPALREGDYRQLFVAHEQMAFLRQAGQQRAVVLVNAAPTPAAFDVPVPLADGWLSDRLNPGAGAAISGGRLRISVPPTWARILAAD
ncbi:MAG: alpha-amylase, partial [Anaerolineae bacterium]|nr:alpha-amylase [Anaerolineae bacterium]